MKAKQPKRYVENPKIRSMRVRSWFHAVSQASGLTVGELDREFREEGSARTPRSCIWNKYKRGEVVPRSGWQGDARPKLVERVEARYPGTAKWLFSPLWRLADEAPMEMSEIRRIYEGMPKSIRSIFIASENEATPIFWRRCVEPKDACEILHRFRDVDALVALLAMVKEAEVVQVRVQYNAAVNAVLHELRSLNVLRLNSTNLDAELLRYLQSRWKKA